MHRTAPPRGLVWPRVLQIRARQLGSAELASSPGWLSPSGEAGPYPLFGGGDSGSKCGSLNRSAGGHAKVVLDSARKMALIESCAGIRSCSSSSHITWTSSTPESQEHSDRWVFEGNAINTTARNTSIQRRKRGTARGLGLPDWDIHFLGETGSCLAGRVSNISGFSLRQACMPTILGHDSDCSYWQCNLPNSEGKASCGAKEIADSASFQDDRGGCPDRRCSGFRGARSYRCV